MRVIRENVERRVDASKCEQLLKDGYKLVETSGIPKRNPQRQKLLETLTAWAWQNSGCCQGKRSFRLFQSEQRRTAWCPERVI